MKVWVVTKTVGYDYAGDISYPVCVFSTEEKAYEFVVKQRNSHRESYDFRDFEVDEE